MRLLPKLGNPDSCPPKQAIFGVLFGLNQFSWPNDQLLTVSCLTDSEKEGKGLKNGNLKLPCLALHLP